MKLPDRHLLGLSLAAVCVAALATIGPGMVLQAAADEAIHGVDAASLVRFEDRDYTVDYDDWVSTTPLTTTRVKKVEAGKVSFVIITTTATGTYSTDAMFSRHVQYPGIRVKSAEPDRNVFRHWTNGRWSSFTTGSAGSFTYYSSSRN